MTELTGQEAEQQLFNLLQGTPEQDTEEVSEEAREEVSEEVTEETTEETDATPEETEEAEEEPVEADSSTEETEEPPQTLTELAEAIEVDPEFIYGLKVPITDPRGKRSEFTLSEIKDGIQELERLKDERDRFEQDRQAFEKERETLVGQLQGRLNEADELITGFEKQLDEELKSPDMEALRRDDPAEWTAKRQELEERKRQLREQRDKVRQTSSTQDEERQKEFEQKRQAYIQEQKTKLMEAIPEWKEPEKAKDEAQRLVGYLKGQGLTDQEVAAIVDHRSFVIARKAMLYDEGTKKVDVAKKKVKTLPKRVKPSTPKRPEDVETEAKRKRMQRFMKSKTPQDADAVLLDMVKGR